MRKLLLGMVIFILFCGFDTIEIKLPRLLIICPKCGYVMYQCEAEELFHGEDIRNAGCKPANKNIPQILTAVPVACPLDGTYPYRSNDTEKTTSWYTNKGWMSKRERPTF